LRQLDFIGTRVDDEQEIALAHHLAVLEVDLGQRAANLGAEFDPVDRGKLAQRSHPCIDIMLQWRADGHHGGGGRRNGGLGFPPFVGREIGQRNGNGSGHRSRCRPYKPALPPLWRADLFALNTRRIGDLVH
jgi:hypothetical protein